METTAVRFLQPACTAPKPEQQGQCSVNANEYMIRIGASDLASKVTHKVEIDVAVADMSDHGQVE